MSARKSKIAVLEYELRFVEDDLELTNADIAQAIGLDLLANLSESLASTVADELRQRAKQLTARKQEIEQQLYNLSACQPLIDLYGDELHDAYKDKYPINLNTEVKRIYLSIPPNRRWNYALPSPIRVEQWLGGDPPAISPTLSMNYGTTQLEAWGRSGSRQFILGYAPELNVIFDFTDAYHDTHLRKAPWNFDGE